VRGGRCRVRPATGRMTRGGWCQGQAGNGAGGAGSGQLCGGRRGAGGTEARQAAWGRTGDWDDCSGLGDGRRWSGGIGNQADGRSTW
jgi:hypothetical protein